MNVPYVSVVMAVYNGGASVEPSVRSLLVQSLTDLEIIVVNDGSTDETQSILDSLAEEDSRLRVIHQANHGLTQSLINAVKRSTGALIARQDAGDISHPGRFQAQADYLQSRPTVVAVGCGYRRVGPEGEWLEDVRGIDDPAQVTARFLAERRAIVHAASMFRREAYVACGGYRPEFIFAQDHDLWYRLMRLGKMSEVSEVLCDIECNLNGISGANRDTQSALADLARRSYELRVSGKDDASVLEQASEVSHQHRLRKQIDKQEGPLTVQEMQSAYLIGSQLFDQRDPRCRRYLMQAVGCSSLTLKALAKVAASYARRYR